MTEQKDFTEYGLKKGAEQFPLMCVLSFTYACNGKCPHCPYNNSGIRDTYKDALYMSRDVFESIACEAGEHGSMLRITGGGEPMLHPTATKMLLYAKSKGCEIGLITNGSRFSVEDAEKLIAANIDMIEFSVDAGNQEEYAKVRGL
jgi:MoaA/NifB/PqqE/SkfB family radical SAM enzyme